MPIANKLEKLFLQNYEKWFLLAFTYVKNKVDAEDIVHQVCYKILERSKESLIEDLDAYVVVSIKNTSLKRLKKQRKIDTMDIAEIPDRKIAFVDNYTDSYKEKKEKLEHAIADLPNSSREIFKSCVIEQEKYTTVAEQMNLSTNTIKYHIKKCYKILRLKLAEE